MLLTGVDKKVESRRIFLLQDHRSLLRMIYNLIENRFYKRVAIIPHKPGRILSVRDDPKKEILPV